MSTDNTLVGSSSGLQINLVWDNSVLNLAAATLSAFEAATVQAAEAFTNVFSNPMTLNIRVGYGEVGGTSLASNTLGESTSYITVNSYANVASALKTEAAASGAGALLQSAAASLPVISPAPSYRLETTTAEAKALALAAGAQTIVTDNMTSAGIDGYVGFSGTEPMSYDPTGSTPSGDYDFTSIAEHEISEVMGRISLLNLASTYSVEDLFRYTAPGVRDPELGNSSATGSAPVYLSADGGVTAIATFNDAAANGGDLGDANGATLDPFNAFADTGAVPITQADIQTMNLVGYTLSSDAVCFYAGTLIATPDGPRAVESLAAGDLVTIVGGGCAPLRWLGRQTVSTRFADPLRVLPIRIRAGALDEAVPSRDLLVSPDHALLLDGVLVQAGALVNGVTILREADVPEVFVYYHVETADHSLILAEGAPAETFIDNVDRLAFDNWNELAAIAEAAPLTELNLPRAKSARQLPQAMRRRLAARMQALSEANEAAA